MNNLDEILGDLYELDPGLKEHEEDLKKLIQKLLEAKPDLKIDQHFLDGLRRKLSARADELKAESPATRGGFTMKFNKLLYPFAGGVLAAALIIVVIVTMNSKYRPSFFAEKAARQLPKVPSGIELSEEASEVILESEEDKIALKSRKIPQDVFEGGGGGFEEGVDTATDDLEAPEMTALYMPDITEEEAEAVADRTEVDPMAIREEANAMLVEIEKIILEKSDEISDELRESLNERINVLKDLLKEENADPEAIRFATEELEQEMQKIISP